MDKLKTTLEKYQKKWYRIRTSPYFVASMWCMAIIHRCIEWEVPTLIHQFLLHHICR